MTELTTPKPQSFQAWILATRPKTLLVGITPVIVGTLITPIPFLNIDWWLTVCLLMVTLCIQISSNMINDALDFKNRVDTEDRVGPLRVTQSGLLKSWQVLAGSFGFILAALCLSIPLIKSGGIIFMYLTIGAILSSYLYTGGPYPLSSTGLSEPFVIIFYGFVATLSAYYLQTHHLSLDRWIAAAQIGILATGVLVVNNLRDVHQDAKAKKRTLVVRFGIPFGKWELCFILLFPYLLNMYYLIANGHFLPFFFPSFSILIAINILRGIWKHEPSQLYNRYLAETAILTLLFGILLALGFRAL